METTERLLRAVLRLHLLPALRCWELEMFSKTNAAAAADGRALSAVMVH